MRAIRLFSRFLLGLLFIFSGFVKAVDPWGSAYKFSDYFHALGVSFLESVALPLAIFLSAFEIVLGIVLILGYQKRRAYWALFLFMSFFTALTFILALTNPVTDCGCFGDAIILTNWETFFKNLIFMVFVLLLFKSRKKAVNVHSNVLETLLILVFFTGSLILSLNAIRHLPILDFRPYDVGTFIPGEMEVPDGAPRDEYETVLYYRNIKTGNTEEFSVENYPQDTLNYQFVTSESKLVKKGYEPPIHDFGIMDPDGFDVTDELLSYSGYTLLMISHDLKKANRNALYDGNFWSQIQFFADDFRFVPVTASVGSIIDTVSDNVGLDYTFFTGDEIMLKTMIRSNPGFIMLKNGTIISKWGYRRFPALSDWNSEWPELLHQFAENQDIEIMMLIEEGLMEPVQWDLIDFDQTANSVIMEQFSKRSEWRTWTLFILVILIALFITKFIPSTKTSRRV
ncbi:MAG: BT_3928 family protein [Bacteroidales bacterium]